MRYFIRLAYDGSNYHGWQKQKNALSVQEEVESALSKFTGKSIEVVGCGRTDAGVHAKDFYLHFNHQTVNEEKCVYALNGILPKSIVVFKCMPVHEDAHTRFDAKSRSYEYHLHTRKDPFLDKFSADIRQEINVDLMNAAAAHLLTTEEFGAFCKAGSDNKTNLCDVREAVWVKNGHKLTFKITADRFLRNMVRAIVGTLLEVGTGKISEEDFINIIKSQNRNNAGVSVPAHGLYLTKITYSYLNER